MSIDLISYARSYKSAGGSRDAWVAAYDDAPAVDGDHIPGTDRIPRADGHILSVGARNHIAGEKANMTMSERTSGRSPSAREPVAMEQEIQVRRDRKGLYLPKEPSAADVAAASHAANLTFFQVTKLRGKFLAAYKFGDLKNAKAMNYYENLIIDDLLVFAKQRKIADDVMVSDGIDETELRRIVKRAKTSFAPKPEALANG